jgi:hypothetical protein
MDSVEGAQRLRDLSPLTGFAGRLLEDGGEMLVLSATCAYVTQWATATDVRHESQIRYRIARLFGF